MKRTLLAGVAGLSALGSAYGQGLYYAGSETQENSPLKWTVGVNATYDDNVNPTSPSVFVDPITSAVTPNPGYKESAYSINPYVGVSFVSTNPQTTWDVYGRLGLIYYLDKPSASGSDDLYTQARAGVNLTHRFNERLRLSSRSFIAYELEPDYAYGFASSRQVGEYFYWETDNSLGYRWTERLATYTGLTLSGLSYDSNVPNADRFTWALYNQFRYQFTPQTVGTLEYRYSQTDGDGLASDANDQFILVGIEHRLSPNTIFVAKAGAQIHDVDSLADGSTTNPYFEAALNSQINTAFRVRAFARYSNENYDTVRTVFGTISQGPVAQFDQYEFTSRETFRLGVSADYTLSSRLSVFAGVDYIPASFDDGNLVNNNAVSGGWVAPALIPPNRISGLSEDLVNAYIGLSVKFTDRITGDVSYNYTDSSSDLYANSYNRNRINVGVRAEF